MHRGYMFLLLLLLVATIFSTSNLTMATNTTAPFHAEKCSCVESLISKSGRSGMITSPLRIAAVGDSITYGNLSLRAGEGNYPLALARLLGCPERVTVANFGVSGATASTVPRGRGHGVPYNATRAFKLAVRFFPHVIVLMLGTNDAKPKVWAFGVFERHLAALVDTLMAQPQARMLYLVLPPPVSSSLGGIDSATLETNVLPALRRFAAGRGLPVIDLHAAYTVALHHDGVHPSRAGHDLIAGVVRTALCK